MRSAFEAAKTNIQKLETPGIIQQVETHLVFGPLARHLPVAYLAIVFGVITLIWSLTRAVPVGQRIGEVLEIIIVQIILLPAVLLNMTRRQQALGAWLGTKLGLGFAAFMMLMIGGFGGLAQGHRDAVPDLFLGVIWIPGVESIPKIAPHQKYVTIARLLLSVPCIYFGIRSGE